MSEVSVLSQEYKTASDLSQRLNAALIALKKACLDLPGAEAIGSDELACQQQYVAGVVDALLSLLAPQRSESRPAGQDGAVAVPGALVAQLRAERRGDLDYFLDDLEQVQAHLREGTGTLTQADLERLDELAAAADAQTSNVFRRLMRT